MELTPAQKAAILEDFKEWAGGFEPAECETYDLEGYCNSALSAGYCPHATLAFLMEQA
jgi:hypothetical protein